MGALLKLLLCIYVLSLIFGCFICLIRFIIDVAKWHDKERPVTIISSNDWKEVENLGRNGNDNGGSSGDTGDRNTEPIIF